MKADVLGLELGGWIIRIGVNFVLHSSSNAFVKEKPADAQRITILGIGGDWWSSGIGGDWWSSGIGATLGNPLCL